MSFPAGELRIFTLGLNIGRSFGRLGFGIDAVVGGETYDGTAKG